MKRALFLFFLPLSFINLLHNGNTSREPPSYASIFGTDWLEANSFITGNNAWMRALAENYNVDYYLAVAMVFPELVRYSALRDKMEITLLKTLYTQYGSDYADFSVGRFQMKPSCAETILSEARQLAIRKPVQFFTRLHRGLSEKATRAAIVRELETPESQFLYVIMMIRILETRFDKIRWKSREEKIRFYAAAYNGGFYNSESWIRQQMDALNFHTGMVKSGKCYSYAAIAAEWYVQATAGG